jgi:hypothetical protein
MLPQNLPVQFYQRINVTRMRGIKAVQNAAYKPIGDLVTYRASPPGSGGICRTSLAQASVLTITIEAVTTFFFKHQKKQFYAFLVFKNILQRVIPFSIES